MPATPREIQAVATATHINLAALLAAAKNVAYNATPLADQPGFVKIPQGCVEQLLACIHHIEQEPRPPTSTPYTP